MTTKKNKSLASVSRSMTLKLPLAEFIELLNDGIQSGKILDQRDTIVMDKNFSVYLGRGEDDDDNDDFNWNAPANIIHVSWRS